ncbi:hypothetical protein [Humisphaera borealis]|uniref:HEAT repeat domain-containing protein n=1 Tax=Humisphaera borealis TaxID=2807512 RepID=A0A7M2X031_9BACT|nr:hypothetical protein [Humisphaera borealis]QOV90090.1 hypothetical protein IPV69_01580 [Humisphaera borealis]
MKWVLYLITSVAAFLLPLSALAEERPSAAIFADRPEFFAGEPIRVTTILTNSTSKALAVMLYGRSSTKLRIRSQAGDVVWERQLIDSPLSNADVTEVEPNNRLVVEVAACCTRTGRKPAGKAGDLTPLVLPAGRYVIEIVYFIRGGAETSAKTDFAVVVLPDALAAAQKEMSSPDVLEFLSDNYISLKQSLVVLKRIAKDHRAGVLADQANYVLGSYLLARMEHLDEESAAAAVEYFLAVSDASPSLKARSRLCLLDVVERSEFVLPLSVCREIEASLTISRLAYAWLKTEQEWRTSRLVLARRRAVAENNIMACIAMTQGRFELPELSTMLGQMRGPVDREVPQQLISAIESGTPNVAILSAFALARTGLNCGVGIGSLTFAARAADGESAKRAMYALRELARRNVEGAAGAIEGSR